MGLMYSTSWAALPGGTTEVPEENCLILGLLHGVAVVYIIPSHNQINTGAFEQTSWEMYPQVLSQGMNERNEFMSDQ